MSDLREDVHPLGEALKARAGDVLAITEARSRGRAEDVDPIIRDRFERINRGRNDGGRPLDRRRGGRGRDQGRQ